MNWSEFYFACFVFGFGLSVIALLGGTGDGADEQGCNRFHMLPIID